jgi:hypothetical protein
MSNPAYDAKVARRASLNEAISHSDEVRTRDFIIDDLIAADYAGTAQGEFANVERIILRWERPDWFEYLPDPEAPFSFTRASGEVVTPGRMLTDGGSIPRWFWVRESLSPISSSPPLHYFGLGAIGDFGCRVAESKLTSSPVRPRSRTALWRSSSS